MTQMCAGMMTVGDRKNQTIRKVTQIYAVRWMIESFGDFGHFHIIRDPVLLQK